MEMFNDLQGDVELRQRYQFWFYFYPTGQPFWFSGSQFRRDWPNSKRDLIPIANLCHGSNGVSGA